jgi:hypothetical protein
MAGRTAWLPNPASRGARPASGVVRTAKVWLRRELGHNGPVWLFPTRFLRRKNLGEAILLTRWLRPDATLVTTAGVSSPDEAGYARRLEAAAKRGGWPVRFKILAGRRTGVPSVSSLMCAADNILVTSMQEGFGLPFLEAAALGLPLLARRLDNVGPDLRKFGLRIQGNYDEVFVPPELFDHAVERRRQELVYAAWKRSLPRACRSLAGIPMFLCAGAGVPVPFSRLTLAAQLEILSIPPAEAWKAAAPCNPGLVSIAGLLGQAVEWPAKAGSDLTPAACAKRFLKSIREMPDERLDGIAAIRTQEAFIGERLRSGCLYPLLMES